MKNPRRARKIKNTGRGPLARKVIASICQHDKKKVVELAAWKEGKRLVGDLKKTVTSIDQLQEFDPIHGVYIFAQNLLSVLIEQIVELPILDKLSGAFADAEEEYMPSGPPMSPLTTSFFTCWGSFDLSTGGAKKETLTTVACDLCKFMEMDTGLITLFEKMQESRMGIYMHQGISDGFVFLRELITDEEIKVISTSGYLGHAGELWFCRILPAPIANSQYDYSIVFTTPYVLGINKSPTQFTPIAESEWLAYFARTLPKTRIEEDKAAYKHLMKYGLSHNYWNEYVFLAYRNHMYDMIMLEGIPDISSSLPHAT